MVRKHPINCPSCGYEVFEDNKLMIVLYEDVHCPECDAFVMSANVLPMEPVKRDNEKKPWPKRKEDEKSPWHDIMDRYKKNPWPEINPDKGPMYKCDYKDIKGYSVVWA